MAWKPQRLTAHLGQWVLVVFGLLAINFGCGPLKMLGLMLDDGKLAPESGWKLAQKDKEVKVAVLVSFANGTPPTTDLHFADRDLAQHISEQLRQRFDENQEKVTLLPQQQIRDYQNKNHDWHTHSPYQIGKHFKVDYLINLEIDNMSLFEPRSSETLFRGNTEITVTLIDLKQPPEETPRNKTYTREYPRTAPRPADESQLKTFKTQFLSRVARDIVRNFSAYPSRDTFDSE